MTVTCLSVEVLPAEGDVPPRRVERWSDGVCTTEFLFPPSPPDPLGEAALRAQLVAQCHRAVRDPWAIRREHEEDLAVAFGEPAFADVRGSLEVALRALLTAVSPEAFDEAREELHGIAIGLTLRGLVADFVELLGCPPDIDQMVKHLAPPSERARSALAEVLATWMRHSDSSDLEARYRRQTVGTREFRPRPNAAARGRVEQVLHETRVP